MLRRRVRKSFLVAAIGFIALGLMGVARQDFASSGESALTHYGLIALDLAQGLLYAAAWLTTRKPIPYRNDWAVTASIVSLAWGGYRLWLHHADIMDMRIPLIGIAIAMAGIYVFAPGGAPPKPESATDKAATTSVASGSSEPPLQQPSGRKPSSSPTAIAPSLAALRGQTVEPDDRWDPLQYIRTPETLHKLKAGS